MDTQKKQVIDKLKAAKNVLVTVSSSPSVDQLSACLGLTLMLNKLGKHASAVFSGETPSTIEFLKPEDTLETNTNSLRDFIIALDKSKADKLRYKVEDKVVRIFITPYKTSISQDDLEFSEGDFNVDVVMALGVKDQADIDQAVTAHGNILHDATVVTLTTSDESGLGSIHWRDPAASGVSELAASMSDGFDKNVLDEQIATAFLTGIVAQTDRFSNNLTSSETMKIAAQLMSAGANQQLVATKLEEPPPPPPEVEPVELPPIDSVENEPPQDVPAAAKPDPGTLEINHEQTEPSDEPKDEPPDIMPLEADDNARHMVGVEPELEAEEQKPAPNSRGEILEGDGPDTSQLTANAKEEELDPSTDPFSLPPLDQPLLKHDDDRKKASTRGRTISPPKPAEEAKSVEKIEPEPAPEPEPEPKKPEAPLGGNHPQTINEIEESIHSPHLFAGNNPVSEAPPEEEPLPNVHIDENGLLVHHDSTTPTENFQPAPGFGSGESAGPMDMPQPPSLPTQDSNEDEKDGGDPPPPVAPPIV